MSIRILKDSLDGSESSDNALHLDMIEKIFVISGLLDGPEAVSNLEEFLPQCKETTGWIR